MEVVRFVVEYDGRGDDGSWKWAADKGLNFKSDVKSQPVRQSLDT